MTKKEDFNKNIKIILVIIVALAAIIAIFSSTNTSTELEINNCGEGTVKLDLCWQQASTTTQSWESATEYCENLELGNKDNWRLPTLTELQTIVVNENSPRINETLFPETLPKHYWTSTEYAGRDTNHMYIHFESGYQAQAPDHSKNYAVRCVR